MHSQLAIREQEGKGVAPPRDRAFNAFRVARTARAKALVGAVSNELANLESFDRTQGERYARKRSRRPADQARFGQQVEALACDLAWQHLHGPGTGLRVTRSKGVLGRKHDRYTAPWLTEKLVDVIDLMVRPEMGHLELDLGRWGSGVARGRQTVIRPGERLISAIHRLGLTLDDFGLHEAEEVLVLKSAKGGFWGASRRLDYEDTSETVTMRLAIQRINRGLEAAEIEYDGSRPLDARQRRLKRLFSNGSFAQHGRLYGGFWLELPGSERLEDLRIDGSPVVALDYGQMGVRLLYALAGKRPHFQDAYAIPGLEAHRAGVKKMLNALIASPKALARFPKGANRLLPYSIVRDGREIRLNLAGVVDLISDYHAPIREQFHQGTSLRLMFMESQIMVQVLLRLRDLGITALPVHDGLVVAEEHAETAFRLMHSCFRDFTGFPGVVTLDHLETLPSPWEREGHEDEDEEEGEEELMINESEYE